MLLLGCFGYLAGSGPPPAHLAHVVNHAVAPPTMKWDVDIAPWELEYGLQKAPVFLPDQRKV